MNSEREKYAKALTRSDLSQWLLHLTKDVYQKDAFSVLKSIISELKINSTTSYGISNFEQLGSCCFYDIPPQNYHELIQTNTNNRKPYGIIVGKSTLWSFGGRPAIYSSDIEPSAWPIHERFRLISTNLSDPNFPKDWTHEREWRFKGSLSLYNPWNFTWWWPLVNKVKDSQDLFRTFSGLHDIYVMELNKVINKTEIHI